MVHEYGIGIVEGARVELHPACDLWMQGARFGTVRIVDGATGIATVRMDNPKVRKLQRFKLGDLRLA